MRYISCFSGIGGLEGFNDHELQLLCEIDPACREVLAIRHRDVPIHDDVRTLKPPLVDVVVGGWPCTDISVAGKQAGLAGAKSGLFYELVRVAKESGAHTLLAENVPALLTMDDGAAFRTVLGELHKLYPFVGWRVVNVREFGLPHQRRRVLIVASQGREIVAGVHRPIATELAVRAARDYRPGKAAAFYWTAGLQSICYSPGYTPTLKVGSSLSIPSPPAIHLPGVRARKLSPWECLALQGFHSRHGFEDTPAKDLYRMAGNAVARPMGRWLFGALGHGRTIGEMDLRLTPRVSAPRGSFPPAGVSSRGFGIDVLWHTQGPLASNLGDYLDPNDTSTLSLRASAGLLKRLAKSGKPIDDDLRRLLTQYATEAT